ncbi:hypothetical protein M1146_08275, partial [Patescibacteria group bacterium]|nr:hypothetical protein [Patescibacteria group bacterium]
INSGVWCEFRVYKVAETSSLVHTNQSPTNINNTFFFRIPNSVYNTSGEYTRVIQCNNTVVGGFYKSTFVANSVGEEVTTPMAIFYSVSLFLLIFLFIVNVITIPLLPSTDTKNPDGEVMELEPLKYGRMLLYLTAYAFLTAIMFIGSNVASAFLQTTLLSNILFMGFRFLMWGAIIGVPIWIILIILNIFNDKETKNMLERGVGQGEWETP